MIKGHPPNLSAWEQHLKNIFTGQNDSSHLLSKSQVVMLLTRSCPRITLISIHILRLTWCWKRNMSLSSELPLRPASAMYYSLYLNHTGKIKLSDNLNWHFRITSRLKYLSLNLVISSANDIQTLADSQPLGTLGPRACYVGDRTANNKQNEQSDG